MKAARKPIPPQPTAPGWRQTHRGTLRRKRIRWNLAATCLLPSPGGGGRDSFWVAVGVLCAMLRMAPTAEAGAWLQRPGGWYVNATLLLFLSQDFYDLEGNRQPLGNSGKFEDIGLYLYAEYGLSNSLTVIGSLPYKRLEYRTTSLLASSSGIGDIYLGLKYGLSDQPYVLSVQAGVKLAPGYATSPEELGGAPPLGDGQTDFELRLLVGKPILTHGGYFNLDAGYRARSGAPVDEIPLGVEFGYNLSSQLLAVLKLYGVRALAEGTGLVDPGLAGEGNLIGSGEVEDLAKLQAQLFFRASQSVGIGLLWEQILVGRNTTAGTTFGVGLAFSQ